LSTQSDEVQLLHPLHCTQEEPLTLYPELQVMVVPATQLFLAAAKPFVENMA
jgi:hypothetical protein